MEPRARRMWRLYEPLHAVTYFAPQALAATEQRGLRGFWRGYMATRLAPLGTPGVAVAQAVLHNFEPSFTARSVPEVWSLVTPQEALDARLEGAVAALQGVLPGVPASGELLVRAAREADTGGRALAAANADLPWPEEPWARLWHATTVLREHRGDGHVAVLVTEGLSGLDAHVLKAAGGADAAWLQKARGWSPQEWEAAADGLRLGGVLDDGGGLTDEGTALVAHVEERTDALAEQPWDSLGDDELEVLAGELLPLARGVAGAVVPFPNPVGVPAP